MTFDPRQYQLRLGHEPREISLDGLAALQQAQMRAIAFENIDAYSGVVPDLDEEAIWTKLVLSGRGGWCLELNLLFGVALGAFDYSARRVLGRVRMGAPVGGPRAHLAHIVAIGSRRYLVDTGFGGPGPDVPLQLFTEDPVTTPLGTFRLRADTDTLEQVVERRTDAGWFPLWGFDDVPVTHADIDAANIVCARWERSPFPQHLMLYRVTATGRISLFDRKFNASTGSRMLTDEDDFATILRRDFALRLSPEEVTSLWARTASLAAAA